MTISRLQSTNGNVGQHTYVDKEESKVLYTQHLFERSFKGWYNEMDLIASKNKRVKKRLINGFLSPPKNIGVHLTMKDWQRIAERFIEKLKINDHQAYVVLHNDTDQPHIHFMINRVDIEGNAFNDSFIGKKAGLIADEIARENGWKTAKELSKVKKQNMLISLENSISISTSWTELKDNMFKDDYVIELSSRDDNEVYGIRIIPKDEYKDEKKKSKREKLSKKGFKLSKITRKLKVREIEKQLRENKKQKHFIKNFDIE